MIASEREGATSAIAAERHDVAVLLATYLHRSMLQEEKENATESALLALREAWDALDFGRVLRDPLAPPMQAVRAPERVQRLYEAALEAAVEGVSDEVVCQIEEEARERRWGEERAADEEGCDPPHLPDPVDLASLPTASVSASPDASDAAHAGVQDDELLQELLSFPEGADAPASAPSGSERTGTSGSGSERAAPRAATPGDAAAALRAATPGDAVAPPRVATPGDAAAAPRAATPGDAAAAHRAEPGSPRRLPPTPGCLSPAAPPPLPTIAPSPLASLPSPEALRSLPMRSTECRDGALLLLLFLFSASLEAGGWRLRERDATPSSSSPLVAPASALFPLPSLADSPGPTLPEPLPAKIYLSLEAQRALLDLARTLAAERREVGRRALAELRARRAFVPGGPTPAPDRGGWRGDPGRALADASPESRTSRLYASCAPPASLPSRARPPLWSRAARLGLGVAAAPEEGEALAREIRFGAAMGLGGVEATGVETACREHAAALDRAWERLAEARGAGGGDEPGAPLARAPSAAPPRASPSIADLEVGGILAEYARLKTAHVLRVLRGDDAERPRAPPRGTASSRASAGGATSRVGSRARRRAALAASRRAPESGPTALAAMDIASERRRLPRAARLALARDAARRRELERRVADWLRLAPEAPGPRRRGVSTPIELGGGGDEDDPWHEEDMPLLPGLPDTWEAPPPRAGRSAGGAVEGGASLGVGAVDAAPVAAAAPAEAPRGGTKRTMAEASTDEEVHGQRLRNKRRRAGGEEEERGRGAGAQRQEEVGRRRSAEAWEHGAGVAGDGDRGGGTETRSERRRAPDEIRSVEAVAEEDGGDGRGVGHPSSSPDAPVAASSPASEPSSESSPESSSDLSLDDDALSVLQAARRALEDGA